jgi:hypothetical protein
MNDVPAISVRQAGIMQIQLVIDPGEPPLGTIRVPGEASVHFTGWLELLGLLSGLLKRTSGLEFDDNLRDVRAGESL